MNDYFKLDIAIENGDLETVRKYKDAGYSLYAEQMAIINGHGHIVDYINKHSTQRNNTGVVHVHSRYDKSTGKRIWDSCVPVQLRPYFMDTLNERA
jgi:hypothetical protein